MSWEYPQLITLVRYQLRLSAKQGDVKKSIMKEEEKTRKPAERKPWLELGPPPTRPLQVYALDPSTGGFASSSTKQARSFSARPSTSELRRCGNQFASPEDETSANATG